MNFLTRAIYKPRRLLFYINPTPQQIEDFYLGEIPAELMEHEGKFGTYDVPGLFIINNENEKKEVLGIEFRPEDDRIDYPKNLESMILPPNFMVTFLDTEDTVFDRTRLDKTIEKVKDKYAGESFFHNLHILKDSNIIQFFTFKGSNRFFLPANTPTKNEFFGLPEPVSDTEKLFFNIAFTDAITQHHNWSYLWPLAQGYSFLGIPDFVFVHFNVKDFKALNVVYGHDKANNVLLRIANHMKEQDWIYESCRCDNDNFAMMIKDMPEEEIREKLSQFFNDLMRLPEDKHYKIYFRCGVVPMRHSLLLGEIVADAGKQAQNLGYKSFETEILFFTDQMHDELFWSSKFKTYLDIAIEKDEFLVYFQPKYALNTEQIVGAEALIRWKFHGRELLPPAKFIPLFEQSGLIKKLDTIVLDKVCKAILKWQKEGLKLFPISINLSRKRLGDPNLVSSLTKIVDSYGINHSLIEFELTETASYEDLENLTKVIKSLKQNGFKISIDDFGTGYSNLSLLTTIPVDTIKIDKSLVDGIGSPSETEKDTTLLKNIICMSKELHFTCLTEGAETKTQIEKLRNFGCEIVQGYYYSKPLPQEEYEELLKK